MKKSTATEHEIALQLCESDPALTLFRNNVGETWQGNSFRDAGGRIVITSPRRVQYGLCPGSCDRIGYKTITVTPEMVGQKIAIFIGIEIKTGTGQLKDNQRAFIDAVKAAGGRAGVARCIGQARDILK